MRKIIVIRTHYLNATLFAKADALQSGGDYEVIFAIDERTGSWNSEAFVKISLTEDAFKAAGLFTQDNSLLWRFGDYIFYLTRRARPEAKFIWILENDVHMNVNDPKEVFRRLDAVSQHDLLASHVSPSGPDWFWHKSMADHYPVVFRCFFPVVRLSQRAIDRLYGLRVIEGASYGERERNGMLAPNDEAFVATVLAGDQFSVADINQFSNIYTDESFGFNTLCNENCIPSIDGKLYHPVLSGEAYLNKLKRIQSISPEAIIAAVDADPELGVDDCAQELLKALSEVLRDAPDSEELVRDNSIVGRALALPHSDQFLERVALCLLNLNKNKALSALKCIWPNYFQNRPGPFRNVAKEKPASQSSTCEWSKYNDQAIEAAGANDGDRSVECGCHTAEEDDPWWQVDLEVLHEIWSIEIVNRKHMADRLAGFQIGVSVDGCDWNKIFENDGSIPTPIEFLITLPQPVKCRFLKIMLPARGMLHIVEFSAFGYPDQTTDG